MNVISIVKYTFSTIGLVTLLVALLVARNTQNFLKDAVTSEGKVVELVRSTRSNSDNKNRSKSSTTYRPVVIFETQTGNIVEFTSSSGSNPPRYSVDDSVEVLYKESSPAKARINEFFSLWGVPLVFGSIGSIFFLAGLSIILRGASKNKSIRYLKENGIPIKTKFQSVEINTSLRVNGRRPYRIFTQWLNPTTSNLHVFSSEDIWFDPSDFIKDDEITVLIKQNNPKVFYVDTSFLPDLET